jgi:1-acyl-sn-glycerol-3-phosphate acyltransferase/uncharacterized Zn finger protein (UPF0148 family)
MARKLKTAVVQPRYKKPNPLLYFVLWVGTLYIRLFYRATFDRQALKKVRSVKGPVIIVASHHGPMDFTFATQAVFPKRVSFVTAANIYYKPFLGWLFRFTKSNIPKKQFTTDFASVKSIRRMLDAGVSVALYPEARFSIEGRNSRVSDSVFKLVKWLKVPVVTIKCNMSYQIRPRYIDDFRRGKVIIDVANPISAADCETLSVAEIKERLTPWLTFNDMEYQEAAKQYFRGKKGYAEGLPDLLYKCPKCGAEFAHKASGDIMECAVCGNSVEIDGYNAIKPHKEGSRCFRRVDLWYDYQYNELKKEISENPDYTLSHNVRLFVNDENNYRFAPLEAGTVTLDRSGIVYRGTRYPEVRFRIPNPPAVSIDLIDHIDLFADDDTIFRFVFDGPEKPIKLNMALEIISDIVCSR